MLLCGYCSSKKLFTNLDRHKCEATKIAAKEKINTQIMPLIKRLTKIVINKMKTDDTPISPVLMWERDYRLVHLDEMIDFDIKQKMYFCSYLNERAVLENSVNDTVHYCLRYKAKNQYGDIDNWTQWVSVCYDLINELGESGVPIYISEFQFGSFRCDFNKLNEIINNFIENYKFDEITILESPKKFPNNIILYLRVSTSSQNANNQNKILLNFCIKNNLRISATFEDVGSARVPKGHLSPPALIGFSRMLDCQENTCILVTSVDRFGRNVKYVKYMLESLHKKNCYVYVVGSEITSYDEAFMQKVKEAEATSDNMSEKMKMIKNL